MASLPSASDPSAQLLSDLHNMNDAGRLADGSDPLAIWLTNALAVAGNRQEASAIAEAHTFLGLDMVSTIANPESVQFHPSLREIENKLDALLQRQSSNALQDLLAAYEERNPGLSFEAKSSPSSTDFTVRAKPGAHDHPIADLGFPDTPSGERGYKKYRRLMERGEAIELLEGEFVWESKIVEPLGERSRGEARTISVRIEPQLRTRPIPVAIMTISPDRVEEDALVQVAFLSLVRLGFKELEFVLSGGQLAGRITFVLRDPTHGENSRISVTINPSAVPPHIATDTVRLFRGMMSGHVVRIASLEDDTTILNEASRPVAPRNDTALENYMRALQQLVLINKTLKLTLRYPLEQEPDELHTLALVAQGITVGTVDDRSRTMSSILPVPVESAIELLNSWEEGKPVDIVATTDSPWTLCGVELHLGPTKATYHSIFPTRPLADIRQQLSEVADQDTVNIEVRCKHVNYSFERFLKAATSL